MGPEGLIPRASVEHGKPLARHRALRVTPQAVVKSARPYPRVVSPRFPGDVSRLHGVIETCLTFVTTTRPNASPVDYNVHCKEDHVFELLALQGEDLREESRVQEPTIFVRSPGRRGASRIQCAKHSAGG